MQSVKAWPNSPRFEVNFGRAPTEDGGTSIVAGTTSFVRASAIVALAPLSIFVAVVMLLLSTLLFLPTWAFRRWCWRISTVGNLGLRLWPLASSASLLLFIGAYVQMLGDGRIFQHYAAITPWSSLIFVASVLAVVAPLGSLIVVWRHGYAGQHRGLRWHAHLVLGAHALLAILLLWLRAVPTIPFT